MRRAIVILIAIVAVVVVIAAIAPASLAGVALERATNGVLTLAEADGTVWRGRGTLTDAGAVRVPLAWSIDPWPMLRGELRLHVFPPTATGLAPFAEITARANAVAMRELDVTLPADVASALAPRSGLHITGAVRIATPSLDWTPATFVGGARVDWQDARFALRDQAGIGLGTVSAMLTAAGDRLSGPVTNNGGDFEVHGTLSLAANGVPGVSLAMTPRGGDPAQAHTLSMSRNPGESGWNIEYRAGSR